MASAIAENHAILVNLTASIDYLLSTPQPGTGTDTVTVHGFLILIK